MRIRPRFAVIPFLALVGVLLALYLILFRGSTTTEVTPVAPPAADPAPSASRN